MNSENQEKPKGRFDYQYALLVVVALLICGGLLWAAGFLVNDADKRDKAMAQATPVEKDAVVGYEAVMWRFQNKSAVSCDELWQAGKDLEISANTMRKAMVIRDEHCEKSPCIQLTAPGYHQLDEVTIRNTRGVIVSWSRDKGCGEH